MGCFLIDGGTWNNRRGYGRFTRGVVEALARGSGRHVWKLLVATSDPPTPPPPPGVEVVRVDVDTAPAAAATASGSRSLLDLWRFRSEARRSGADGIFFPTVYSWFPSGLPSITVIHDTIPESLPHLVFPNLAGRLLWTVKTRAAVAGASALVTVSESARDDVARRFGRRPESLTVVGEGFDSTVFHPRRDERARAEWRRRAGLPDDGFLLITVGGLGPHKNLGAAIRACARLKAEGTPIALLVVGGGPGDHFHSEAHTLAALAEASDVARNTHFTGYLPDGELGDLMRAADALLFPSLLEGFGLPALEALACGTPVVSSGRGALREVTGTLAVEADPSDTPAFAAAIRRAVSREHAERLAIDGPSRAAAFTWDASARPLLPLFDELARK